MSFYFLFPIGFFIGLIGSYIGTGGGFLMMPVLIFLFPSRSSDYLTAVSLAIVFFNVFSGSIAYAKQKKIDYRSGLYFILAGLPGSYLGAVVVQHIKREEFNFIFAIFLLALACYLFVGSKKDHENSALHLTKSKISVGFFLSTFVGFLSSLMGIGGGIVHVPLLVRVLKYPVHFATATSHFILVFLSLFTVLYHASRGIYDADSSIIILYAGIGAILGAQFGAHFSKKTKGPVITRALSIALVLVALRLLLY